MKSFSLYYFLLEVGSLKPFQDNRRDAKPNGKICSFPIDELGIGNCGESIYVLC